jgi:putative transposase
MASDLKAELAGRWEPIYRSQLHYMITWYTRGRRAVLRGRHVQAVQSLVEQVCADRGFTLLECAPASDCVRLLVGLSPTQSVASAVRELKGRTGVALMSQFPELRVWLRGNLAWDERYAVETISASRLERARDRIRAAHGGEDELAQAG